MQHCPRQCARPRCLALGETCCSPIRLMLARASATPGCKARSRSPPTWVRPHPSRCALGLRAQAVAVHVGKTWARELHVTPLGLTPKEGGSYDYSCLVPSALKDDPTKGGLLCAPPNACPASAEGADRGVLGAQVVAQLRPGRVRPQSCAEGLLARTLLALSPRLLSGCGERAASGRRWPALCGGGCARLFSPGDANFA